MKKKKLNLLDEIGDLSADSVQKIFNMKSKEDID
jgi:hypothetical protein